MTSRSESDLRARSGVDHSFLIGAFAGAGSVVADACGQWRVSMSPMAPLAMEGNGVAERFANRVTGAVFEGTLRGGREGYDNIFAFDVHAFDAECFVGGMGVLGGRNG